MYFRSVTIVLLVGCVGDASRNNLSAQETNTLLLSSFHGAAGGTASATFLIPSVGIRHDFEVPVDLLPVVELVDDPQRGLRGRSRRMDIHLPEHSIAFDTRITNDLVTKFFHVDVSFDAMDLTWRQPTRELRSVGQLNGELGLGGQLILTASLLGNINWRVAALESGNAADGSAPLRYVGGSPVHHEYTLTNVLLPEQATFEYRELPMQVYGESNWNESIDGPIFENVGLYIGPPHGFERLVLTSYVPEPSGLVLAALATAGLATRTRRFRRFVLS